MSVGSARRDRRFERRAAAGSAAILVALFALAAFASREEPRWRARYYPAPDQGGKPVERWEQDMRFEWGRGSPDPRIPPDRFSARFETCLVLPEARRVAFLLTSYDGASLAVDGARVVDLPGMHPRQTMGVEVDLGKGAHLLAIEYEELHTTAVVGLSASLDGRAPKQIPNDRLRRPSGSRCQSSP